MNDIGLTCVGKLVLQSMLPKKVIERVFAASEMFGSPDPKPLRKNCTPYLLELVSSRSDILKRHKKV